MKKNCITTGYPINIVMMKKRRCRFILPCFRKLKKKLGKLDAIVECNELAVREFISNVKQSSKPTEYINEVSLMFNVKVNNVDIEYMPIRISHLYILSTYQQAEIFIKKFRNEHPASKDWRSREDKESPLKHILDCINISSTNLQQYLIDIFEYYREVRNRFAHEESKENSTMTALLTKIKKHEDDILKEYKIIPNKYENINFDDFLLFSRVTKDIALELCNLSQPTDDKIIEMLKIYSQYKPKLSNKPERLCNAYEHQLKLLFNLDKIDAERIAKKIYEGLIQVLRKSFWFLLDCFLFCT